MNRQVIPGIDSRLSEIYRLLLAVGTPLNEMEVTMKNIETHLEAVATDARDRTIQAYQDLGRKYHGEQFEMQLICLESELRSGEDFAGRLTRIYGTTK